MSTKKYTPKIRFAGFTDDWEQRKLGEVGKVTMCKRIFKNETNEKYDIPFYKIGTFGYLPDAYISNELFYKYKKLYPYPKKGDILISASGTLGRTVVYNGENAYYQDSNIVWLDIDENRVSNQFLQYFYETVKWFGIEGSTIKRLYNSNILSTSINLPSMREQTAIGNFFKQLDETIALHQREAEKYKNLKNSYLEKMFPTENEQFPKLRFPNFTDAWEQRKLGEIVEIVMGQSPSSRNYTDNPNDFILVQGNADIKNGFVYPRVWTKEITKTAKKGTLIFSVRAPVGDIAKTNYDVVLGRGVASLNGNEFIYQTLSKIKISGFWEKLSSGSTFESINSNDIRNAEIYIPSQEEQTSIGNFFKQLDETIALHQRKIEKYQFIKQLYLERMFIK